MHLRELAARTNPGEGVRPRGSPLPEKAVPGAPGSSFAESLRRAREGHAAPELKLSAHAEQRIRQRGISFSAAQRQEMGVALQRLEAQGARDALLLRSDAAFVVNVPNRTVVTALDGQELQSRLFTQIDSALLL